VIFHKRFGAAEETLRLQILE